MTKKILYATVLFLSCAAFAHTAKAAVVDKIVVVVNNEIITRREIDVMLAPVYEEYKKTYQGA